MIRGSGYPLDDGTASTPYASCCVKTPTAAAGHLNPSAFPQDTNRQIDISTGLLADLGRDAHPFCASTIISHPTRSSGPAHGELRPRAAGGAVRGLRVRADISLPLSHPCLINAKCPRYPLSKARSLAPTSVGCCSSLPLASLPYAARSSEPCHVVWPSPWSSCLWAHGGGSETSGGTCSSSPGPSTASDVGATQRIARRYLL
jgi:hypothetical protein